jgi:hypothetical protein
MTNPKATISLDTECPGCGMLFDILGCLHQEVKLIFLKDPAKHLSNLNPCCVRCCHTFKVDLEY